MESAGPFKGPVLRTFTPASSLRRARGRVPERASNCVARAREASPCNLYIAAGALRISKARTCILWLAIAETLSARQNRYHPVSDARAGYRMGRTHAKARGAAG